MKDSEESEGVEAGLRDNDKRNEGDGEATLRWVHPTLGVSGGWQGSVEAGRDNDSGARDGWS